MAEIISGAGHDLTFAQAETVNRRMVELLREPDTPLPEARIERRGELVT
jgi:hypothetical protein